MLLRRECTMSGYVDRGLSVQEWRLSLSKNHLIETASTSTGSLLVWDTGEYEMLPYREKVEEVTDDELSGDSDGDCKPSSNLSDSEKLHAAFRNVSVSSVPYIYSFKGTKSPLSAKFGFASTGPVYHLATPCPSVY